MRRSTVRVLAFLVLAAFAAAALAVGVAFVFSSDSGQRKAVVGITDSKFPPPRVARDPLLPTALWFDSVLLGGADGKTYVSERVRLDPWKVVGLRADVDEYAGYCEITYDASIDPSVRCTLYHVRGDLATIDAVLDKARGANPAWNVTFSETR